MSHRSALMLVALMVVLIVATSAVAGEHACLPVTVCFTPGGNCTALIVQGLHTANRSVLVQAYSFTSAPIAKALLDAHTRGVQVQVILDKSQRNEKYSSADFLATQGVPTLIDATHGDLA
jgi:phosphatidylserine/phosphatidylglycerophosphate/cardiolipin synthase-like enzyme